MGVDEEGTIAALEAIRRELADPRIVEHLGRIVLTTGDGLGVCIDTRCPSPVRRRKHGWEPSSPLGDTSACREPRDELGHHRAAFGPKLL